MKLFKLICISSAGFCSLAAINYGIAAFYDTVLVELARNSERRQIFELFWSLFGIFSMVTWLCLTFNKLFNLYNKNESP